jgi:hypothetical protein
MRGSLLQCSYGSFGSQAVFSEPRRRASRLGFSIMFELFQDVADCSVAFHLCEQTPSFPTLYFSLARCSRMRLRWRPAERGRAGAGRSSVGLAGDGGAAERNNLNGDYRKAIDFIREHPDQSDNPELEAALHRLVAKLDPPAPSVDPIV